MVVEKGAPPPNSSYLPSDQTSKLPLNQLPTGINYDSFGNAIVNENQFVLGIHRFLLFPGPVGPGPGGSLFTIYPSGRPVTAYPTADWNFDSTATSFKGAGESRVADITSSRFDAVAETTSQLMREIALDRIGGDVLAEADRFCYRFKTLASVYDTDVPDNPFVNGCFRLHPVALQGVSSFTVEWTNGRTFPFPGGGPNGEPAGSLIWFGPRMLSGINYTTPDLNVEAIFGAGNVNGDHYIATFSYFNKASWPKAIRLTYHISEPNNRLQGGRDFVQVINLPN